MTMAEISSDIFKKIRRIQFHTTQLANDILAGAWHSAFKGRGMEFEEVREYQAGDDIRIIDWNVTARMDHPYVKIFREERELTVLLLVDVSASSRFGSRVQLKRDLIAEIGAVLAFSAIINNDNIGLILFSDRVEKYIPPKKGTRHVLRVIRELLAFRPAGRGTDLAKALAFLGGVQRKMAICFLISDFLCDHPLHELSLAAKKHDLIAVAVTDPHELAFPAIGLAALKDLETGAELLADTGEEELLERFSRLSLMRKESFAKIMKKIGAGYIDLRTDEPYILPMKKFFKYREIRH